MKIIVPMAGMGKRMRPHTLTTPKPLIPIAGKPIVHRLVEDIAKVCNQAIEEVAYIIHPAFGAKAEAELIAVAEKLGAKGSIYYQTEALGTAHAIQCAANSLQGNVVIAFADTLFRASFSLDSNADGIIWVKKIEDPRQFGVVELDNNQTITSFYEKPQEFISDLAIIGIYYIKDGEKLKNKIQYLIDNDLKDKGEYQLTDALRMLMEDGNQFKAGEVTEWLDCGNKDVTVETNGRYLSFIQHEELISKAATIHNSTIIEPCSIDDGAIVEHSVIGPFVSIGKGSIIRNACISNAIIQENAQISTVVMNNVLIGNHTVYHGKAIDVSLGDYSTIKQ